jgi:hypothetical protein
MQGTGLKHQLPFPCAPYPASVILFRGGGQKSHLVFFCTPAIVTPMMQTRVQPLPQGNKIEQIQSALAKLLADLSQRGFYGEAGLTMSVQDGRIQHIRVAVERMIK